MSYNGSLEGGGVGEEVASRSRVRHAHAPRPVTQPSLFIALPSHSAIATEPSSRKDRCDTKLKRHINDYSR